MRQADRNPEPDLSLVFLRATRTSLEMRLEIHHVDHIKFAVQHAMQEDCFLHAAHAVHSLPWYFSHAAPSSCRARESGDITVPIGVSVISAIC